MNEIEFLNKKLTLEELNNSLGLWLKLFSPKETEIKVIDDIDKL